MAIFGPPNVEKLKERNNVDGLIKALGYQKDDKIRKEAASALGAICDTRALEPLIIAALDDKAGGVRAASAEALGQIRDARALETLCFTLKDKTQGVIGRHIRTASAIALGQIGDARAVEPLKAALFDLWTNQTAAEALNNLGWKPGADRYSAQYYIIRKEWDECVKIGDPAVEPLIAVLKDEKGTVNINAVDALGRIGAEKAVNRLIAVLDDNDRSAQAAVSAALVKIGKAAEEPLIAALNHNSYHVRRWASETLGIIGGDNTVEVLIPLLKDEHSEMRRSVATALGFLGHQSAVSSLIDALIRSEGSELIDISIALGRIGDTRAVEPLMDVLEKSSDIRVANALANVAGETQVEKLLTHLELKNENTAIAAAQTLKIMYMMDRLDADAKKRIFKSLNNFSYSIHSDHQNDKGCAHQDEVYSYDFKL